jgi:hypothetical protein
MSVDQGESTDAVPDIYDMFGIEPGPSVHWYYYPLVIDRAASTASTPDMYDIYEHSPTFQEAANAMADECDLHCYKGVYYNIPAPGNRRPSGPPFYVITRGRYIGVIPGWLVFTRWFVIVVLMFELLGRIHPTVLLV